jgi:hypothetical protein
MIAVETATTAVETLSDAVDTGMITVESGAVAVETATTAVDMLPDAVDTGADAVESATTAVDALPDAVETVADACEKRAIIAEMADITSFSTAGAKVAMNATGVAEWSSRIPVVLALAALVISSRREESLSTTRQLVALTYNHHFPKIAADSIKNTTGE